MVIGAIGSETWPDVPLVPGPAWQFPFPFPNSNDEGLFGITHPIICLVIFNVDDKAGIIFPAQGPAVIINFFAVKFPTDVFT